MGSARACHACRYDPDHRESLLNPGKETTRRARQTLGNLRQGANVAGNVLLQARREGEAPRVPRCLG